MRSCVQDVHLVVTDLASGAEAHRLLMPAGAANCPPTHVLWSADGHLLAVRLGDAWGLEEDPVAPFPGQQSPEGAGIALADLRTGTCVRVELPSQQRLLDAMHLPCCSAWSSTGHLLVLQANSDEREEASGSEDNDASPLPAMLAVYDAHGSVVASISAPQPGVEEESGGLVPPSQLVWAPSGQLAAISLGGFVPMQFTPLCIWHPFTTGEALLEVDVQVEQVQKLLWSPCSSMLLVQMDLKDFWLCDVYGNVTDTHTGDKQVLWPRVAWGLSGVVILGEKHHTQEAGTDFKPWGTAMHWRSVQQGCLQPPFTAWELSSSGPNGSPACISPDGSHCAIVTHTLQRSAQGVSVYVEPCLHVISSGGIWLQQSIALPEWRRLAEAQPITYIQGLYCRIQWAADGSELICSAMDGRQHVRVSFE